MIIFGTSSKLVQLAMLNLLCGFCGNPSAHGLRKRITKFSLFFIPLFPVAPAKHSMQCTFCGAESPLSKENAEQMLVHGTDPDGPYAPQQPPQSGNPFGDQRHQRQELGNPYPS